MISNSRINYLYRCKTLAGFTLLEVLVALVIIAVGMLGVIQFQASLINTVKESDLRSTATSIAEKTIESLRNYEEVSEFYALSDSSVVSPVSVVYGKGTVDFNVSATVNAFDETGSAVSVTSEQTSYKEVFVTVSWNDGSVKLASIIAKIDPAISGYMGDEGNGGVVSKPVVSYKVGAAPDVVAIDLGDGKIRETSKPLPEIQQKSGDVYSTEVQFETVTYDGNPDRTITEDFVTVNCQCKLDQDVGSGAIGSGLPPSLTKLETLNQGLFVEYPNDTDLVSKATGSLLYDKNDTEVDYSSSLCGRCCEGHHDNKFNQSIDKYRWYWNSDDAPLSSPPTVSSSPGFISENGDHWHFWIDENGVASAAIKAGDKYLENCRFKRVDGYYRLMQDWRLVDITVLPEEYLESDSLLKNYQAYVVSVADEMLSSAYNNGTGVVDLSKVVPKNTNKPSGRNYVAGELGTISSYRDLISRSLYLEPLTSSAVNLIGQKRDKGSWLDVFPLYEVNTRILSNWSVPYSESQSVTVTSEPLQALVDASAGAYGSYLRGRVSSKQSDIASVAASSSISNTGLVGHFIADLGLGGLGGYAWTDTFFDEFNVVSDAITVQFEIPTGSTVPAYAGSIKCLEEYIKKTDKDGNPTEYDNKVCANDSVGYKPNVSVIYSNGGSDFKYNCSVSIDKSGNSATYNCPDVILDTNGLYNLRVVTASEHKVLKDPTDTTSGEDTLDFVITDIEETNTTKTVGVVMYDDVYPSIVTK